MRRELILNKKTVLFIVMAALSVVGVSGMVKSGSTNYAISNSVFSVLIFFAVFFLIRYVDKEHFSRRVIVVSTIVGALFSASMVVGVNVLISNSTFLNSASTWFQMVFGTIPFMLFVSVLYEKILPAAGRIKLPGRAHSVVAKFFGLKHIFIIMWVLILVAWIPVLLAVYPGIYAYDSIFQVSFYEVGRIGLQHPLVHTYLLGFFVVTVGGWLHSAQLGLFLYTCVQSVFLAGVLASLLSYIISKSKNYLVPSISLALFMFLPVNPIMAASATKDIIYTALFAVVTIFLFRIVLNPDPHVLTKQTFAFIIFSFLNIIFRSQGVYVFVLTAIGAVIFWKKTVGVKRTLVLFITPIVLFSIYSGPVTRELHGVKFDSIHEMTSVPAVQMSRALYYSGGELSGTERKEISEYFPNYRVISSEAAITDNIKATFNTTKFKKNPSKFVSLWVSVGLKKPMAYIDAFSRLTIGLWYPDMNYPDPMSHHSYMEFLSWNRKWAPKGHYKFIDNTPLLGTRWLSIKIKKFCMQNSYQKIPLVSMLMSSGFCTWLLILFVGWIWLYKRTDLVVPTVMLICLLLTVFLGPVVLYRYVFPIAVVLPILINIMVSEENARTIKASTI